MGLRGPKAKSALALRVIGPGGIQAIRRPSAPAELTDEQAHEWTEIVNSLPADWFPRYTHSNLANLCRSIVDCRRISEQIEILWGTPEFDSAEYDKLLKMREREIRNIASLTVKCRISQSSSYDKNRKRNKEDESRPWSPRHARLAGDQVD